MSDPESTGTDAPSRRDKQPRSPWWMLSAAIHAIAFAAIIYFTPWQTVMEQLRAEPQPAEMSAQRTERIDRALKEQQAHILRQELAQLEETRRQIEEFESRRREDFEAFERELATTAPQEAAEKIAKALDQMKRAQEAIDQKDHAAAKTPQVMAEDLQREALDLLEMFESLDAEAVGSQRRANEAQTEALDAQERNRQTAEELASVEANLERQRATLERRTEQFEKRDESVMHQTKAVERHEADTKAAEEALEKTRAEQSDDAKAVERAQRLAQQARQRLDRNQRTLEDYIKRRDTSQRQMEDTAEQVAELEARQERLAEQAPEHQAQAQERQAEAIAQQERAADGLAEALTALAADAPTADGEADTQADADASEPQPMPSNDPAAIYEAARQAESQIVDAFERVKAMELAQIRNIPESAAARSIDTVRPERPDLDLEALANAAATTAELEANKAQLDTALREARSMNSFTTMLAQNLAEAGTGGEAARGQALNLLATATDEAQAGASTGDAPGSEASQPATEQAADGLRTDSMNYTKPVINEDIEPAYGRVFDDQAGRPARWVVIDDWYMIGPWDNTGRRNIDRQFPPESIVDLDATYRGEGKGGRDLSWTFVNTDHRLGMTMPPNAEPYGIWYAYTEIAADTAREVWIAFGSDDRGTVWLNDQIIWNSGTEHKNWRVGEALVRAQLQTGRNRVLYRVENGHHGMGFSMLIHPAAPQPD